MALAAGLSASGHLLVFGVLAVGAFRGRLAIPVNQFQLSYPEDATDHRSRWLPTAGPQPSTAHIVVPGPRGVTDPAVLGNVGQQGLESLIENSLELASSRDSGLSGDGLGEASVGSAAFPAGAVVDLTDVTVAAHGNPVRLAYFTAIREQVQRTANARTWIPENMTAEGAAYVQFVIARDGDLRSPTALLERSSAPPQLCRTAMELVAASSPFPPFPPSFEESNLTILLPIEFVSESPDF